MTEPEKPNRGNIVILLIFAVLAIVTIGATVFSTTTEWGQPPIAANTDIDP